MAFTIKALHEMKLSVLIFSVALAEKTPSLWLKRETDVQQAYFNNKEIILQDPKERARRWDACGDKPPLPENAVSVECDGQFCAAICPIGWQSEEIWRIECITKGYDRWSHDTFSRCIPMILGPRCWRNLMRKYRMGN